MYPQSFVGVAAMTNMNMRPDNATLYPGRTYRFYNGESIFPFGFGLTTATFNVTVNMTSAQRAHVFSRRELLRQLQHHDSGVVNMLDLASTKSVSSTTFTVTVHNYGVPAIAGRLGILIFARSATLNQLVAFQKTPDLKPGASVRLRFDVNALMLAHADVDGKPTIDTGVHYFVIDGEVVHAMKIVE
jgi:hypothetical protein